MIQNHTRSIASLALAAASVLLSGAALAAPVTYTYTTSSVTTGRSDVFAGFIPGFSVSGQFTYESEAGAFLGTSDALGFAPGFSLYGGVPGNAPYGLLTGKVGLEEFSDVIGTVAVGDQNPHQSNLDVLSLLADSNPKVGENRTSPEYARQLQGFTVGDYKLHNVRLYWLAGEQLGTPGFLSGSDAPEILPGFAGTLAMDFIRVSDPTNTANVPYFLNTVYFQGLQVQAVPEPSSVVLALMGLALAAGVTRSRRVG